MVRVTIACVALSSLFWGGAQEKRNKPKGAELVVLEFRAHRNSEGRLAVEGRVRNDGDNPVRGLQLIVHVFGPGDQPLASLKGPVETPVLEGGEESEFLLEATAPARAVAIRLEAADKNERDIKVSRTGPYPIE